MTAGRQFHTQQTHYVAAELEYSDFASTGATKDIGVVPKGAMIVRWTATLQTVFSASSGSLPLFVIGSDQSGESARFLATTGIGLATTGFYSGTTGAGIATVDLIIRAKLETGAMAAFPTTGKVRYCLEYIPPNDNKNLHSTFD